MGQPQVVHSQRTLFEPFICPHVPALGLHLGIQVIAQQLLPDRSAKRDGFISLHWGERRQARLEIWRDISSRRAGLPKRPDVETRIV
ncbi:hypothetical protein AL065_09820 [Pseudomonas amygdali pv. ulmi]|nr:hypothetical protein AL065_09820 [Pseudomonas amygdali pv. ulmi]